MTCDVTRNRLLALPDLSRPTDEIRAHLAGCQPCTVWLARAKQLDLSLVNLPAPSSAEAKAAFLDYLTAAGPIIKSVPKSDRSNSSPLVAWAQRLDWRVVSGLAAAALVGVGIWALSGNGKPVAEVAGPKHELLARGVDFVAAMSTAKTPQERTQFSMAMSGDLRDEVKGLYTVANRADLDKLAEMYEKVVTRGLVVQSEQLLQAPVQERHALWNQVKSHLAVVVQDAAEMETKAPAQAIPSLSKIKQAALAGQAQVDLLIKNGRALP